MNLTDDLQHLADATKFEIGQELDRVLNEDLPLELANEAECMYMENIPYLTFDYPSLPGPQADSTGRWLVVTPTHLYLAKQLPNMLFFNYTDADGVTATVFCCLRSQATDDFLKKLFHLNNVQISLP